MPLKHLTINFDHWKNIFLIFKKMNCSCPTCLETFTQNCLIYSTPCGHLYHLNCIERWLKNNISCPQCRKRCNRSDLRRIYLSSEGKSKVIISRRSVPSTDQALPSCFYFRFSWTLMKNLENIFLVPAAFCRASEAGTQSRP